MILAGVPARGIVRVGDRWGVKVEFSERDGRKSRTRECVVDFWDGGREYVRYDTVVFHMKGTPRR